MTAISFIGPTTTPKDTHDLFVDLGRHLARAGAELHTAAGKGTNAAVAAGYRENGGDPVLHDKGLFGVTDELVIYVTPPLYKSLEPHLNRPEALKLQILYLYNPDQLRRAVDAFRSVADQVEEGKGES